MRRAPGSEKPEYVRQIVPGIGEKRGGTGEHAEHRLDDDEADIERRSDREGLAERRGRMGMAGVGMSVAMTMRVTGMVPVAMLMAVMVMVVAGMIVHVAGTVTCRHGPVKTPAWPAHRIEAGRCQPAASCRDGMRDDVNVIGV